ncbi:hypothetical protein GmRootA79_53410 (plasmid) [Acidovorax sp. A79]
MNREDLTRDITEAARRSFSALLAQHGNESFYAFALYTDEDCYTVVPAANSLERHREKLAEMDDDDDQAAYYQWASAEWAYEGFAAEPFNPICDQLAAACQAVSGDAAAFASFKAGVRQAMTDAMRRLDEEGFFGTHRAGAVLFITSSDFDEASGMERRSALALNPPERSVDFLAWNGAAE